MALETASMTVTYEVRDGFGCVRFDAPDLQIATAVTICLTDGMDSATAVALNGVEVGNDIGDEYYVPVFIGANPYQPYPDWWGDRFGDDPLDTVLAARREDLANALCTVHRPDGGTSLLTIKASSVSEMIRAGYRVTWEFSPRPFPAAAA